MEVEVTNLKNMILDKCADISQLEGELESSNDNEKKL